MVLTGFLVILAVVGSVITSVQVFLTWRFRRKRRFFRPGLKGRLSTQFSRQADSTPATPFVSILKPVCGLDDELEQNLESFMQLEGVNYELIISIEDADDPALAVVRHVAAAHPDRALSLVVGPEPLARNSPNRKVARLIAAARVAKGEIIFISDSNIRVRAEDIRKTLEAFEDERTGCVSNLFVGTGAFDFGATIESLHLLSFVVSGNVLAAAAGIPCVVGKSMSVLRSVLEQIGGFEAFGRVLAEDQAIGLAVKEAGYRVVLSPVTVSNVIVKRTLRRAIDRQVRWNKIRYAYSRPLYVSEFLLNPTMILVLATLVSLAFGPFDTMLAASIPAVILLRIVQVQLLARALDHRLTMRESLSVPLLDTFQFGAQLVPFVSDEISWRGYRARIGANTTLLPVR
ncbi:MAG TPA: glycosyltransferase [Thermoanaerobaculia bacterium]|nr:glycosyltransferase [Thermoanaerobaculia bacterium]